MKRTLLLTPAITVCLGCGKPTGSSATVAAPISVPPLSADYPDLPKYTGKTKHVQTNPDIRAEERGVTRFGKRVGFSAQVPEETQMNPPKTQFITKGGCILSFSFVTEASGDQLSKAQKFLNSLTKDMSKGCYFMRGPTAWGYLKLSEKDPVIGVLNLITSDNHIIVADMLFPKPSPSARQEAFDTACALAHTISFPANP